MTGELIVLTRSQRLKEASALLRKNHVGPEPNAWRAQICEHLGDMFYDSDKVAAEWFYRETLRQLKEFAAGATDGADAMARHATLPPVDEKLRYLCSGAPNPSEQDRRSSNTIPGE